MAAPQPAKKRHAPPQSSFENFESALEHYCTRRRREVTQEQYGLEFLPPEELKFGENYLTYRKQILAFLAKLSVIREQTVDVNSLRAPLVAMQYLDDLASVPQSASQSLLDILTDRVHGNAKTTSNDELYVDGVPFSLLLISTVTFIVAMKIEGDLNETELIEGMALKALATWPEKLEQRAIANHILNVVTFLSDCESGAIKQNILQNSLSNRITHSEGLHLTESISQEDWLHIRSIWKRKEPMTVLDDVVEQLQSRFDQYHVYVSTFRRLLQYSGDHLKDQILTRQSEIQEMLLKESCVSTSTASRMRNRVRRQARATQLKDFEPVIVSYLGYNLDRVTSMDFLVIETGIATKQFRRGIVQCLRIQAEVTSPNLDIPSELAQSVLHDIHGT